jgi:UDP-N-acetylmuramate: L-alanyl-gamma-D-glutamyl-meso-diaminopimelate ligase
LTTDNEIIVLEGDEYLSSPIDLRPKFHLYHANIALISGIAWDHINVFPTYENYLDQFRIFADTVVKGGTIIYNQDDTEVRKVVEESKNQVKKYPYGTPAYRIENGLTLLETNEGEIPLEVFGEHNLQNLEGARSVCFHLGVGEEEFYEAIADFSGASKRLEKIGESTTSVIYKDFAHSPSKVEATTRAVKEQYPDRTLLACLELHTYSSLNETFLKEYRGALDKADQAVVFYSPHAVQIKRLKEVGAEQIAEAFQRDDLLIYTDPQSFKEYLFAQDLNDKVLLLMSSGNYGGLDFDEVKELL